MKSVVIEVTNGPNWGKFLIARFDDEWQLRSALPGAEEGGPLLRQLGWSPEHLWVLDLQTGEGALFRPGGHAPSDLNKHRVWVCPMFEPLLLHLWSIDVSDLDALPRLVELPNAPFAMHGYRRRGPAEAQRLEAFLDELEAKLVDDPELAAEARSFFR